MGRSGQKKEQAQAKSIDITHMFLQLRQTIESLKREAMECDRQSAGSAFRDEKRGCANDQVFTVMSGHRRKKVADTARRLSEDQSRLKL